MKKSRLHYWRLLLQWNKQLSIKARVYYALLIISLSGSLLGLINTYCIGQTGLGLIAAAACFGYLLFLSLYTWGHGNIDRAILAACIGINFLIFPLNYLGSGGINGGMPIYFIAGIYSLNLLDRALTRFVMTIFITTMYSALIVYSYFHPEIIDPMPSRWASHIDIMIALVLVAFMLCTSINSVFFAYLYEQKKTRRLTRRLNAFALKDPLTMLYNRRYLSEQLKIHTELAKKQALALSVIMFDIDRFKQINDEYGHLTGDAVLKKVAYVLSQETRSQDVVGRYGGEEFLLLLFDTDLAEAASIAEKIRCAIKDTAFSPLKLDVTISGGIATYQEGMQPHDLIDAADKKLYKAKHSGRNRVISCNDPEARACTTL